MSRPFRASEAGDASNNKASVILAVSLTASLGLIISIAVIVNRITAMTSFGFVFRFLISLPLIACTFIATALIIIGFTPETPAWGLIVMNLAALVGSSLIVLALMGGWGQWRFLCAIVGLPAIQAECALNLGLLPRDLQGPLGILSLVMTFACFKVGLRLLSKTSRAE
jgi:hypothetical protein